MRYTAIFATLLCGAAWAAPLWVALGPQNDEHGLTVISDGDGKNVPDTIAGSPCRRIENGCSFIYVQADAGQLPPGRHDAYVIVEYYDRQPGIVNVEYDRAVEPADLMSHYTVSDDVIVLGGSGKWQRAILHLPDAKFGKGQNWQSDLRLSTWSLAVRRLEISLTRPADYVPGGTAPEVFEARRAHAGPGMEVTFGCVTVSAGQAKVFRALGATGAETYCTWQTVEDAGEGKWDWSRWDKQVQVLQQAGLKWVPLIIAGPAYTTPKWYREGPLSFPYVCLEHRQPTKIQSLWNPAWRAWMDRFVQAFAERYRDRGVLESVLIGCSGTYGETLYPAGPEEGWPYDIPGPFHNHLGWWAGDTFAVADFRKQMTHKNGTVEALNRAWKSTYANWDAVAPFIPDTAPSPRARLDMVNWYVQSMTDWATFVTATVRKHMPATELYLCVGGAGEPIIGADFSAQAKAIAPLKVGLRVTNEGSDYAQNFAVTREVATACRGFGLGLGLEPAGPVDADGIVARTYNASASGAHALHYYTENVMNANDTVARFRANLPLLQRQSPRTHAGVYLSKTSWALRPETQNQEFEAAKALRDRVDTYLIDRATLGAEGLRDMRVLALAAAPSAEPEEIAALGKWVQQGGIIVAQAGIEGSLLLTPEGSAAERDAMFAKPPVGARLLRSMLVGAPPRHFKLEIGKGNDADYLFGDWNGQEPGEPFPQIPGATKRWSGARAGICVPCNPDADATLILEAHLTGYSVAGLSRVLVNGQQVGVIEKAGTQTLRLPVSRALLAGRPLAEVTLEINAFKPTDHGSQDARTLGLAVCSVEMCTQGAENEAPARTALRVEMDWAQAANCTRRLGKGATLIVPDATPLALSEAVVQALTHPERLIPGAKGVALPNTDADGVYPTQIEGGVLWYNSKAEPRKVDGSEVPAHGMVFAKN